jgi:hypothetical protein
VSAARLATLAKRAGDTGRAVGKASVRLTTPVARKLQQQQPETIAKLLLAAVVPRLVNGVVRFAIRNPKVALIGAVVAAVVIARTQEADAEPA